MSKLEIAVRLSPQGIITIFGNDAEDILKEARAVELWHSQPDKGLAFRFLDKPTPTALPLIRPEGGSPVARIDASSFLVKVGMALPDTDHEMAVGNFDDERGVLATRW